MADKKMIPQEKAVIFGLVGLVVGFALGMFMYHLVLGGAPQMAATPQPSGPMSAPPPANLAPPGQPMVDYSSQIRETKRVLETDPANRRAWVQLGNLYFDSEQPAESVEAYTKALAIDDNDANVITDRGIMYRRLNDFSAAVADFKRANEIDPTHQQSLYNLGLTLLHDLNDPKGALEAWEKLVQVRPETEPEMRARLEALRNMAATQGSEGAAPQQ